MKRRRRPLMTGRLRDDPALARRADIAGKALLGLAGAAYAAQIVALSLDHAGAALFKALAVPALGFLLTNLVRQFVNAPRPYEDLGIEPAVPHKARGEAFPSMQAFFAFVVGMVLLGSCPSFVPGTAVILAGAALGAIRVALGLHRPRDVIGGAAAGMAFGFAGFFV